MKFVCRSLFFSFVLLWLYSCNKSRFPGFSETKNGLYYKLIDIGDGQRKAFYGDYVTAQIVVKSEKDSILFDTRQMGINGAVTFELQHVNYPKEYKEGYQLLSEGDSAIFITDAYTVFIKDNHLAIPKKMNMTSILRVETRVLKIRTRQEHLKYLKEESAKLEWGDFEEMKIRNKYISDKDITMQPFSNGMYYITIQKGKARTLDSGKVAMLHYKGYFLNGRCFDSSFETHPFEYIIGAEDQLIQGLMIGLRKMHEGEKAKFIIPSCLAFGSKGSSTGIVPPYTTVIYEVELLKIQ